MESQQPSQLVNGLITFAILALIVRRTLKTQTVRVWTLVVIPILLIIVAIGVVLKAPAEMVGGAPVVHGPSPLILSVSVVIGAVAGAALGYARGIHSKVALGPRPGTLVVQGNVLLVVILVTAFGLRFGLRSLVNGGELSLALSDGFIVFAAASVAVARGMLFFAWRRLVATGATSLA